MKPITFQEAIVLSKHYNIKHLLLGNGFSIACPQGNFSYKSLFDMAAFDDNPKLKNIFKIFATYDFEEIINTLEKSALLSQFYCDNITEAKSNLLTDANRLRKLLIQTIAKTHPDYPSIISQELYNYCKKFLSYFANGKIFTLNYDLLLYWTLMGELNNPEKKPKFSDGFGKESEEKSLSWQHKLYPQTIYFLHGALHLYEINNELIKLCWKSTNIPLMEQSTSLLDKGKLPLFVSEGTYDKKLKKILHDEYLSSCYNSFRMIMQTGKGSNIGNTCLFTYGFSFSDNDKHIYELIEQGRIKHIFIGIYGNLELPKNKELIATVESIKHSRKKENPLEITYYDSKSANVWNP